MNIRVVDEAGELVAQGRSLAELRAKFRVAAAAEAGVVREEAWQRDGITRWDFGELPERVEVKRGDFVVVGFPALLDRGEDVSLRLLDNRSAAQRATARDSAGCSSWPNNAN